MALTRDTKQDLFFLLPIIITTIACIGLVCVWSATYTMQNPFSLFFKKQLFGVFSGSCIFYLFSYIDYRHWIKWSHILYPLLMGVLFFTLFKGSIGLGGQRWIDLGFTKFQPSELAKLLLPAFATYHLYQEDFARKKPFDIIIFTTFLSFILIRKQPDLGTALIILCVGFIFCWFSGLGNRFFFIVALLCTCGSPFLWYMLKPYQKQRITVFLGEGDVKKEAYQKEQALIAIGSGSIKGKGLLGGTQNKLHFLPEGRTDFIFAVLCEEFGFLGALGVLLLYLLLFIYFFIRITTIKNSYMQLLALGTVLHIILSTLINISMVLGMLPIVGIPLPLFSYGITHLWITYASLGIFQNISTQKTFYP